ncbi:MAG TPA: hypothetical protein VF283_21990 [Bryobacteraceae bacterium]
MNPFFEPDESRTITTKALAACFCRPDQSLWAEDGWTCPHCSELNRQAETQCHCGFSVDDLTDFRNKNTFSVAKLVMVLTL